MGHVLKTVVCKMTALPPFYSVYSQALPTPHKVLRKGIEMRIKIYDCFIIPLDECLPRSMREFKPNDVSKH